MSRKLNDLHPAFRPLAIELLARLTEDKILVLITDTLRTKAEHLKNLRDGRSWIKRSLHMDGLAIDVCPFDIYELRGPNKLQWDAEDPVWQKIGPIGEKLGLDWGGRWQVRDMAHFEHARGSRLREIAPLVQLI